MNKAQGQRLETSRFQSSPWVATSSRPTDSLKLLSLFELRHVGFAGIIMLTEAGCRGRIQRLIQRLQPTHTLILGDPVHLRYFANAYCDPFYLGADFPPYLVIQPNGHTTLVQDHRAPKPLDRAFADEKIVVKWYDGLSAGLGPRRMVIRDELAKLSPDARVHDSVLDPLAPRLFDITSQMRRQKDPDELALLSTCMKITEAGHTWARTNVRAGMSELDVYAGIAAECTRVAGQPVVTYGDFAVSPGSAKRGGMATNKILTSGETLILDFSVVLQGYRSDFTNTLVVGGQPTPEQFRIFNLCVEAMAAGEAKLRAGVKCQDVYDAVRAVFARENLADKFPHHAGHGLGASHPEAPYFVAQSEGELLTNDVVTLEPGLYIDDIGGVRIEHNYQITDGGCVRLSNHTIALS